MRFKTPAKQPWCWCRSAPTSTIPPAPIRSGSTSSRTCTVAMQVISFKNTVLFKRGVWLSAAALMAFVAGPAALSGEFARKPLPSSIAISILGAALAYFFWKTQVHRLVDEVLDCRNHLQVSRGRVVEVIPMADISKAEVISRGGFHRITLRL